ncbi:MAG TPA: hypothetical protein VJN21_09870 [Candidatus Acidoferrales bacterium]|nr:hypothetical protein [Candidatus Acidoferrales bacterium]
MGKKAIYGTAFVAAIACLAWASNDPWKTKSYQQWDQKDVQQVLSASPWVKIQSVPASWTSGRGAAGMGGNSQPGGYGAPGQGGGAGEDTGGGAGASAGGGGAMGTGARRTGGESPMDDEGAGQGQRYASFTVRWNSAQTIREALARSAVISGKIGEAEAAKFVAQEPAAYEIFVNGTDMSPFASVTEEDLKANAHLDAKQSKQKVQPSGVTIQRSPDNKKVAFIAFSFPRQAGANQPLITAKDKSVEFGCKLKNLDLRANFDLHKMVNEKGLDM